MTEVAAPSSLKPLSLVKASGFKAIPHLESSSLMQSHPKGIRLSDKKPNVVVGPNGSGKSSLLKALAMRTMSELTGLTELDSAYVKFGSEAEALWKISRWPEAQAQFLPGLECDAPVARALYYRPSLIPGDERCATTAMMTGYFESARTYLRNTENKSSGQACQAQLEQLLKTLEGGELPAPRKPEHWQHWPESPDKYPDDQALQRRALVAISENAGSARPLVLMDEPEQSLDARAELELWARIASTDCSKLQLVVATHSLYPLLHPKKFKLIEAVPGYVAATLKLLNAA